MLHLSDTSRLLIFNVCLFIILGITGRYECLLQNSDRGHSVDIKRGSVWIELWCMILLLTR